MGVINLEGRWVYTLGMHPVYEHRVDDLRCFRLTVAQLVNAGACRPCEIMTTFGISKSSLDRALRMLRGGGIEAFFESKKGKEREGASSHARGFGTGTSDDR